MTRDASNNLYLTGTFTSWKGVANTAVRLAKLSSVGVLDTTFANNMDVISGTKVLTTSGLNAPGNAIMLYDADSIIVGGSFDSYGGNVQGRVMSLGLTGIQQVNP